MKYLFTELFFLMSVAFFIYEFRVLLNPKKSISKMINYTSNKNSLGSDGCLFLFVVIVYFVWTIIGVSLASQWYSFLTLIGVSIITALLMQISKNITYKSVIRFFDSVLSSCILIYIYFNHFHTEVASKFFDKWLGLL